MKTCYGPIIFDFIKTKMFLQNFYNAQESDKWQIFFDFPPLALVRAEASSNPKMPKCPPDVTMTESQEGNGRRSTMKLGTIYQTRNLTWVEVSRNYSTFAAMYFKRTTLNFFSKRRCDFTSQSEPKAPVMDNKGEANLITGSSITSETMFYWLRFVYSAIAAKRLCPFCLIPTCLGSIGHSKQEPGTQNLGLVDG